MTAFVLTRIQTGDYDRWRPLFDQDRPQAREAATVQRVLRRVDDPNHVFVYLEFPTVADAEEASRRLLESGVLDRLGACARRTSSSTPTRDAAQLRAAVP